MSRPLFVSNFTDDDLFEVLRDEAPWVNRESPRDECFMATAEAPQTYSYGNSNDHRVALHTYQASPMHPRVLALLEKLNEGLRPGGGKFNVAVLNYYKDQHQHLGWHADNSPEQDLDHPIAVVSFGAPREIWVRENGAKGTVPPENRFLLTPGSLFLMHGGYQGTHQHRIPKCDRECGGRISITFRKLDR